jgi:hypothetical protein
MALKWELPEKCPEFLFIGFAHIGLILHMKSHCGECLFKRKITRRIFKIIETYNCFSMRFNFILPILLLLFFSCKEAKKEHEKHINVFGYIKGQLAHIDTVPYGIVSLKLRDTVAIDSTYIDAKQLRAIVKPFMDEELEEDYFNENFTQSVFGDATIGTITISYLSKREKEPIERMDVYANPQTGDIRQVYILKRANEKEKSGKKQLLWVHNQGFTIYESVLNSNGEESSLINKVILQ